MKTFRLTLRPLTAFGTALVGDTLFGHLCWAALERLGRARLQSLLDGYTDGRPFAVLSDAFPHGFLPKPTVPAAVVGSTLDPRVRKRMRNLIWLPAARCGMPLPDWLELAQPANVVETTIITQNTIHRLTGTTGELEFAPRQVERIAFASDIRLDLYAVLDEDRLKAEVLRELLEDIGTMGYGRDASTGLGKFAIDDMVSTQWPQKESAHWLTLAPCAPEPASLDPGRCFYQPITRFGRHGGLGVRFGQPFKRPLLLLKTGALLTANRSVEWVIHGRGLGGRNEPISDVIPETVHQGYAPLVPLNAVLQS
ncbi:MAG: CRISPR-associated protein Csm7 [Casimicrobiaceae bacterium]|nr:CRISPR-associated protein Csm7 [Casimicrobiaceae bacterium]